MLSARSFHFLPMLTLLVLWVSTRSTPVSDMDQSRQIPRAT